MHGEERIVLADGRTLAYAEFGNPQGRPVLYCHGSPSSRLEPMLIGDEVWRRLDLRLIAPDRPGIGASDFQRGRGFSDWPADVVQLADALQLHHFSMLGLSGGAPYVAVCAARIPERLRSAVIVSGGWRMDWPEAKRGLPFVNRLVLGLARRAPWLLRLLLRSMGDVQIRDPERELARMKQRLPAADYEAFRAPGRLQAFAAGMREALRGGARGPAWDMRLYLRDFGFRPDEVRLPVTWFHGRQDANAPHALAARAVATLPGARLVSYEHEAHLSTLCNHIDEIAVALRACR